MVASRSSLQLLRTTWINATAMTLMKNTPVRTRKPLDRPCVRISRLAIVQITGGLFGLVLGRFGAQMVDATRCDETTIRDDHGFLAEVLDNVELMGGEQHDCPTADRSAMIERIVSAATGSNPAKGSSRTRRSESCTRNLVPHPHARRETTFPRRVADSAATGNGEVQPVDGQHRSIVHGKIGDQQALRHSGGRFVAAASLSSDPLG